MCFALTCRTISCSPYNYVSINDTINLLAFSFDLAWLCIIQYSIVKAATNNNTHLKYILYRKNTSSRLKAYAL